MSIVLQLAEEKLAAVNTEIEGKVGDLVDQRDQIVAEIKKLKRGSGSTPGGPPATSDETLVSTVASLTKEGSAPAVKATDIAKSLGVDSRSIARRLSKMATDGTLTGDKESGYSPA